MLIEIIPIFCLLRFVKLKCEIDRSQTKDLLPSALLPERIG
jgi:hypothetical protein